MPTLFISYKRGTTAVAPLMEKLREAHYRLWFDRDEIHLGDSDWQARIDQGIQASDAVILNITPAACTSEPVRYEVRKARELGKPIFPIVLEKITDYDAAIRDLGLAEKQHIEDFTEVAKWDEQIERLLRDLRAHGLRVTRHDERQERDRDNPKYVLHQAYLKWLVEQIGTLNLGQINPNSTSGVYLEQVYVDSPTGFSLSVELQNWQIVDWWLKGGEGPEYRYDKREGEERQLVPLSPEEQGYERAPLEMMLGYIDQAITLYREENPTAIPNTARSWTNRWSNGTKEDVIRLHLNHLAAARDRLVILGAPGSGKSTFVKYLALCLAGAGIDDWTRTATITVLDNWPHGALTPVYVELRRFVASQHFPADISTPATTYHLWQYLQEEVLADELAGYADDLQYDLEHGHALLILDGLDEVPYPEGKLKERQAQLIGLAQSVNTRYAGSRVIVASRPYAYEGWTLPGFEAVTIREFEDAHRIELAIRLYQSIGMKIDSAAEKAQAFNRQLEPIDQELKDRPLFVTLMATIYLKGDQEGLPTRRGALYRESILLLLDRWTSSKPGAPSLMEILGDKALDDLYERLAALAFDVHAKYGEQPATPEIDESLLYKYLKPLGRGTAAELIPYLSENAGVLVSPGQDDEKDVFHFAHRTFQEYLAAAHLVMLCKERDSFAVIRDYIMAKPLLWGVPGALVGDVLADTGRRSDLWDLIGDLVEDDIPDTISGDDPRWQAIGLAGVIVTEQRPHEGVKLRRGEQAIRDNLVDWLVRLIETAGILDPIQRVSCGQALGLLGDPRRGVGVKDGIPDIDWVTIPAGPFLMGSDTEKDRQAFANEIHQYEAKLPAYRISRYLITYAQFQAFIDDPGGFHNSRWWKGLAMPDGHNRAPDEQAFKFWNHPRERISWYDAVAFCRWLSAKLHYEVRLPTEQEWEKAARGTDGRIYPYGDEFDAVKGNTKETGIGQTSAVGLFPDGASPYGLQDMSGNTWEWCLTQREVNVFDAQNNEVTGDANRILHGGSWDSYDVYARAACRADSAPDDCHELVGFRVVCHRDSL